MFTVRRSISHCMSVMSKDLRRCVVCTWRERYDNRQAPIAMKHRRARRSSTLACRLGKPFSDAVETLADTRHGTVRHLPHARRDRQWWPRTFVSGECSGWAVRHGVPTCSSATTWNTLSLRGPRLRSCGTACDSLTGKTQHATRREGQEPWRFAVDARPNNWLRRGFDSHGSQLFQWLPSRVFRGKMGKQSLFVDSGSGVSACFEYVSRALFAEEEPPVHAGDSIRLNQELCTYVSSKICAWSCTP